MTLADPNFAAADREAGRARLFTRLGKADTSLKTLGFGWITPLIKATLGTTRRRR